MNKDRSWSYFKENIFSCVCRTNRAPWLAAVGLDGSEDEAWLSLIHVISCHHRNSGWDLRSSCEGWRSWWLTAGPSIIPFGRVLLWYSACWDRQRCLAEGAEPFTENPFRTLLRVQEGTVLQSVILAGPSMVKLHVRPQLLLPLWAKLSCQAS